MGGSRGGDVSRRRALGAGLLLAATGLAALAGCDGSPASPASSPTTGASTPTSATPTSRFAAKLPPASGDVSVYISPHQDDETLSMGAAIRRDVLAGRDVVVVLVTGGESAKARELVNADLARRSPGATPLSGAAFSAARDREFTSALGRLGVDPDRIARLGVVDSDVTPALATQVVDAVVARYGAGASYATMSWLDANPTHYRLAYALDRVCVADRVAGCAFYQFSRYRVGASGLTTHTPPVATPTPTWVAPPDGAVLAAAREYALWDPGRGRYAIGWSHSVPSAFTYLEQHPADLAHPDGRAAHWPDAQTRAAALAWTKAHQRPGDAHDPGVIVGG